MSSPSSRERLGLLLGFIGMAIFGGTLPATRIAVAEIDPIALTSLRTAIAGLCSLALLLVLRRKLPPRALWPQLVITMLCVAVLFPLLMSLGMQRVDASHGGVVLGVLPIATALVAVAITHERPRPLFWIASVAGAALVIAFALRQGGGALAAGDLFLFASVAVAAIGYAFSGRLTSQMPGWEVISWVLVIALPLSIPAAALTMPADITPHRAEAVARAALCRAVLAMDRVLRMECRPGDGRHRAGVADPVAAALRHLCARGVLQRRDHHAADPAVRRRRRGDGRDLDAHARLRGAGIIEAGSRAASVGGVLIDQFRVIGHQFRPRLFRLYGAKQDPRGFQMIHLHAQLDDLAH